MVLYTKIKRICTSQFGGQLAYFGTVVLHGLVGTPEELAANDFLWPRDAYFDQLWQ